MHIAYGFGVGRKLLIWFDQFRNGSKTRISIRILYRLIRLLKGFSQCIVGRRLKCIFNMLSSVFRMIGLTWMKSTLKCIEMPFQSIVALMQQNKTQYRKISNPN